GGEDEDAGADRDHARLAPVREAQGVQQAGGRRLRRVAPSGYDDRVGGLDRPISAASADLDRSGRPQRPRIHRADREFVPRYPELRARQPEHLDRDRQLEQRQTIVGDDDDPVRPRRAAGRHGQILSHNVVSAYRGGGPCRPTIIPWGGPWWAAPVPRAGAIRCRSWNA